MQAGSWPSPAVDGLVVAPRADRGRVPRPRSPVMARMLVGLADLAAVAAAMVAARVVQGRLGLDSPNRTSPTGYQLVGAAALPLWVVAFSRYRLYQARRLADRRSELGRLLHAVTFGVGLTAVVAYGLGELVSQVWLGLVFLLALVITASEREVVRRVFVRLRRAGRCLRPVAVAGSGPEAASLVTMLVAEPALGYQVVALVRGTGPIHPDLPSTLPVLERDAAVAGRLRAAGARGVLVAVTDVGSQATNRLVRTLTDAGLHVELTSSLEDIDAARLSVRPLGHRPVLYVEPVLRGGGRPGAKRAFDLVLSATGLLLTLPLLVVAAAAIKATSRGPVLYRQARVGRDGRMFTILKLRSMYTDSDWRLGDLAGDPSSGPVVKLFADPRVTAVGRVLRRFSIDEIPQLVNVLAGHMSMVGPRPEQASEVELWPPEAWDRLRVRPGLTGLWQVSGRSEARAAKQRWDLYYVDNWSLWRDITILARTVPVLLAARGAY